MNNFNNINKKNSNNNNNNNDEESETYRHLLPVPFIATCNLNMNIDKNNDTVVPVL